MGDSSVDSRCNLREVAACLRDRLARPLDLIIRYLAAFGEDDTGSDREESAPAAEPR